MHASVTLERVIDIVEKDTYLGFCVHCGKEYNNIELEADGYWCDTCDQSSVYGAAKILIAFICKREL